MKPRHILMAIGVAVTAWLAIFGDKTPKGEVAEAVARPTAKTASKAGVPASARTSAAASTAAPAAAMVNTDAKPAARKDKVKPEPVILALRPRAELIGGASAGNGGALFASQNWNPPPPPPPVQPAGPPPPPSAPPLAYTYIGKKFGDAAWEVYLAKGEQTFIVREKATLEDQYRVESIKPPLLTLTYLPLNQMQTMNIGGAE